MKKFNFTSTIATVLLSVAPIIVLSLKSLLIFGEPNIPEHLKSNHTIKK